MPAPLIGGGYGTSDCSRRTLRQLRDSERCPRCKSCVGRVPCIRGVVPCCPDVERARSDPDCDCEVRRVSGVEGDSVVGYAVHGYAVERNTCNVAPARALFLTKRCLRITVHHLVVAV